MSAAPGGIRWPGRSCFGEGLEAADDFLSRGGGAADDEDRVLAADGADDFVLLVAIWQRAHSTASLRGLTETGRRQRHKDHKGHKGHQEGNHIGFLCDLSDLSDLSDLCDLRAEPSARLSQASQ